MIKYDNAFGSNVPPLSLNGRIVTISDPANLEITEDKKPADLVLSQNQTKIARSETVYALGANPTLVTPVYKISCRYTVI